MTATTEREGLINASVPFTYYSTGGGHTWSFWQSTLEDFLTRVGFRTTSTTATAAAGRLTAQVAASTAEPAVPTGTVRFKVDGVAVAKPVALVNGKAVLKSDWTGTVTAVYSGDRYYNSSTGTAS
ncbi:Ig-like domain repeat protein [Streptomyces sp. NPDC002740]